MNDKRLDTMVAAHALLCDKLTKSPAASTITLQALPFVAAILTVAFVLDELDTTIRTLKGD